MRIYRTTMSAQNSDLVRLQETIYNSKNSTRKWLHSSRREWITTAIERMAAQGKDSALEVGAGIGIYTPVLAKNFNKVVAIDIQTDYLCHAEALTKKYNHVRFLVDDITRSSLPSHSFDLVLCTEVIEHIKESVSAIKEMHRLLKPGGILILSTPQKYSTLELTAKLMFKPGIINLVKLIYSEPVLEMGHINLMTRSKVMRQLKLAGFQIREQFASGFYAPIIAETAGDAAVRLEKWLEMFFRKGPLNGILWTQYFIAQTPLNNC